MIGTVAAVIRGEGIASALRRASERVAESAHRAALLARSGSEDAAILNVSASPVVPRLGGVPIQLRARLREERAMRSVALFSPGMLEFATHARRVRTIAEALAITGARVIHLEGTHDAPIDELLGLGIDLIVTLHDFTLKRRELLAVAKRVIAPSRFVLDEYEVDGLVVEPGASLAQRAASSGQRVAYAGAVKPHKGGHLLNDLPIDDIFGGGDEELLRNARARVHGYYRARTLPSLLAKNKIGLVVLPSIVPESFSLTLSESWLAGVPVVAFDHGAIAERICKHGGGWLAPLDSGAKGLNALIARWRGGETVIIPTNVPTARDAARAHVALYQSL